MATPAGPAGFVDDFPEYTAPEYSGEEGDEERPVTAPLGSGGAPAPASPPRTASPRPGRGSPSALTAAVDSFAEPPAGGGASASGSRRSSSGGSVPRDSLAAAPPWAQGWAPPWPAGAAGGLLLCPAGVVQDPFEQDWVAIASACSCTRAAQDAFLNDREVVLSSPRSTSRDRGRGGPQLRHSSAAASLDELRVRSPPQAACAGPRAGPRLPVARRHRGGPPPEQAAPRADGAPPRPPRQGLQPAPSPGDEPVDHARSATGAAVAAGHGRNAASPLPSPVAHLQAAVSDTANRVVQRLRAPGGDSAASSSSAPFQAAGLGSETIRHLRARPLSPSPPSQGGGGTASAPSKLPKHGGTWSKLQPGDSTPGDEEAGLTPREKSPGTQSPVELSVWLKQGWAQLGDKFRKAHITNVEWAMSRANLGRELAKAKLLDVSAPMRSSVLGGLKTLIRESAVADPDMWPWVRKGFEGAIDSFLNDLEHEIEGNLEAALLKQKSLATIEGPDGGRCPLRCYYRVRAFILYHFLPHDKSIFGKLKDPVYLCMLLLTLLPFALVRVAFYSVVLAMIVFPRPPDEFQLVNFILLFKGSQFLNAGLITMGKGSMKYFICFSLHPGHMTTCIVERGPGASDSLVNALIDYVGSCVLVWIAFRQLPHSEKHARSKYLAREQDGPHSDKHAKAKTPQESNAGEGFGSGKGGQLGRLLWYDVRCFALSLAVLAVVAVVTWRLEYEQQDFLHWVLRSAHFREDLFWCKVLYGILSLPFLPFSVSFLLKVLTHCEYTGYNEHGGCVAFDIPMNARAPNSPQKASPVKATNEQQREAGADTTTGRPGTRMPTWIPQVADRPGRERSSNEA